MREAVEMKDEVDIIDASGSPAVPLGQYKSSSAKRWIVLGIASAVIALAFLPPLFGVLGIVFGCLAKRRGSLTGGVATMYISSAAMVVGMILGALLA